MPAHPLVLPALIITGGLMATVAFLSENPLHVVTDVRPRLGKTPDERAQVEKARARGADRPQPRFRRHQGSEPAVSGVTAYELRRGVA